MPGQDEKSRQEKKTILVVDDDHGFLIPMTYYFEDFGYVVLEAHDFFEAIRVWEKNKPDLVITDIRMPGPSGTEGGTELLKWIRQRDSLIPVIAFSVLPRSFLKLPSEFDRYIEKPYDLKLLLVDIKEELDLADDLADSGYQAKALIRRLKRENDALHWEINGLRRWKEQHEKGRRASRTNSSELETYQSFIQAGLHDLGNELGLMPTSIRRIKKTTGLPVEVEEELEVMMRRLKYSLIWLQRMKIISAQEILTTEPISVAQIVESLKSLAEPRVPSSVTLSMDVSPSVEGRTIETDEWQVLSVVLELIKNASRVLSEEGGSIEVVVRGEDDNLVLSVKDNGTGIPEELRDVILKEPVPSQRGKGLGLYFSRKVIEALGGKLYLESTSSEGTVFSISLPVLNTQEED